LKFLFTTFEGGGHVPPAILAASLLMAKGHEILFVSDQANRDAAQAAGLRFHPWTDAPNRRAGGRRDDPLADWREIWPPAVVKAVCDAVITGPAKAYATDTADLIRRFRPDVVVTNELLFGVLVACEAAGVSTAILTGNLWCFPNRPDVPPFGPGWRPARSEFEHRREASARRMIERWSWTNWRRLTPSSSAPAAPSTLATRPPLPSHTPGRSSTSPRMARAATWSIRTGATSWSPSARPSRASRP
jgi:hypothetical protein